MSTTVYPHYSPKCTLSILRVVMGAIRRTSRLVFDVYYFGQFLARANIIIEREQRS